MWSLGITLAVLLVAHAGAEDVTLPPKKGCQCVLYYLCKDPIERPIIDFGFPENPCPNYLEVCCHSTPTTEPITVSSVSPPPVQQKRCGIRNPEGVGFKITGDQDGEAEFGEFPWMVAVLRVDPPEGEGRTHSLNVYQCGGALIHPKVVLTGAHCVFDKQNLQLKIRAGEWDTQTKSEILGFQDRDVDRVVYHENFMENNLFNDIALLFLAKPVDPAEHIGFACLPPQGHVPAPGTHCFATGWGNRSAILKKIELPVVEHEQCQTLLRKTKLGDHFKLHDSFMCAGGEKGKDTCKGDGGSPLVCPVQNSPNQYMQSGIVAWGIGCGENETPGTYASVAMFRNWIDTKMAKAQLDGSYYSY